MNAGKFVIPEERNWSDWEHCGKCGFEGDMSRDANAGVVCPKCKDTDYSKGPMFNPDGTLMVAE